MDLLDQNNQRSLADLPDLDKPWTIANYEMTIEVGTTLENSKMISMTEPTYEFWPDGYSFMASVMRPAGKG